MAQFRGTIQGQRGSASRLGSKSSGLTVEAQSWQGKVTVQLHEVNGVDMVRIAFERHNGAGISRVLYDGPVSGQPAPIHPDARQPDETSEDHLSRLAGFITGSSR